MATKEVTFQNYNAETGEFFTDTKTCTVVDSNYAEGTLGDRDGQEYWYVVDSSIDLEWFNVRGNVHLILSDGCTLTADKKSAYYSAVNVEAEDSFTIYGQEEGTGKLLAKGGYKSAGIGGDKGETNGTITVNGGVVEAYGGDYGAGIGGGYESDGKNITINGGTVTAEGGRWGAGLGGGDYGNGYDITINGGTVKATTQHSAAGIGGGYDGQGHDITINGGTVNAKGDWSAGIGGGYNSQGYNITINGGKVTAEAINYGAGIGGADYKSGHDITINGGEVTATGASYAAGIGGGDWADGYNIFINGGTVTANGGYSGAGIGGGFSGAGHDVIINGGTVNANGGCWSAGIGGGDYEDGYNIVINDGTVIATGDDQGAGIGGSRYGKGQDITINGGTVTSTGGKYGAGIGGGNSSDGEDITIHGGTVTATGGDGAAGIGSGEGDCYAGSNILISGGTVTAKSGDYISGVGGAAGIGSGGSEGVCSVTITGGTITAQGDNDTSGIGCDYGHSTNITIDGGVITATGGEDSDSSGLGGMLKNTNTVVVEVKEEVTVKAGDDYPLDTLLHKDGENIGTKLECKRYAETELKNTVVDYSLTTVESATYTRGGVVGNGGYYNITATGSLTNTSYILTFDSTSTTGNGGAIYNEGIVNLANTTFSNCYTANGCGGAIYNQGGTVTLTGAVFDSNTSVYGGGSASGGAIYMNSGTLSVTGSGTTTSVFKSNESWDIGGAIVINGGATGSFNDVSFEGNASRSGGAMAVSNGTLTLINTYFKSNAAKIVGLKGGLGGAVLVSENGTLNLGNVTFHGNTATSGGAIYTEKGGKVNLTGNVYLDTTSDTIVNQGTLNWDLTGTGGSTGYLGDYSLLSNGGTLTITVNPNETFTAKYLLASNAANAAGQSFTLTGVSGETDKTITVSGDMVTYNNVTYTLTVNADNELVLEAVSIAERIVVSNELALSNFEISNLSNPTLDGGVFMVENTGDLSVTNAVFTGNSSKNGGAIYNKGKTTLSTVTFNGNTATGSASGAIYNAGTLTLDGAVTLSTASDTIYNSGNLVWNITTSSCGYLSDWSKLTNTGTLTITGAKDNKCGQYKLAENAASATGKKFTLKVGENEKTITVGGEIVDLNGTYYGRLSVNTDDELILTVETKRIEVKNGDTFTIQDGMVLNGMHRMETASNGGVFYVNAGGTLTNDGVAVIRDFGVDGCGGAIYNSGTVSLSHMTFSTNYSFANYSFVGNGGAISSSTTDKRGDAVLELNATVFNGNIAIHNGGAIDLYGNRATITNSNFTQNSSGLNGGAIYVQWSDLTLKNVTFRDNSATKGGGGINAAGGANVYLDNVVFNGNWTEENPQQGAIYNNTANLYLLGNVILATKTDTIYSIDGKIIWILDHGKNGYISNYALVTMDSTYSATYTIDVDKADANTSYILAGNAESADGQAFSLFDGTITVNGDSVGKDGTYYTLYTDGGNNLRFSITQRMVVDKEVTTLAEGVVFTNNGTTYSGNGGVIEVKDGGTLVAKGSEDAPVIFQNSKASGNGGAVCITAGTAEFSNVVFDGNSAGGNGGAIFNQGTVNLSGTVELSTSKDTWYNAAQSKVNWNLSSTGTIANFEQYANADTTVTQTITVTANPTEGDYILASGDMTGYATDLTGKYTFRATIDGETLSNAITVGAENPVVFEGYRYSLSVDDNGTPEIAADDNLVLTVEKNFSVTVDPSLQDKWFKAGETITLFGSYISDDPVTITVDGAAATLDAKNKSWTYTYASHADTTGTPVTIRCKSANDEAQTSYNLKVDTVAPEAILATLNDELYAGEWKNIQPDSAVFSVVLFDKTSGFQEDSLTVTYDGITWAEDTQYTFEAGHGKLTTVAGNLTEGSHILTVKGKDNAGNEFSKTVDIRLDVTNPVIGNVTADTFAADTKYVDGNKVWIKQGDNSAVLNVSITDIYSGLKEAIFNGIQYDGTKFALATDIEMTVSSIIVAKDNAGNINCSDTISYCVDGTGPSITVTHVPSEEYTYSVNVTAAVTDGDGSGVKTLQYSFDGMNWINYEGTFSVTNNGIVTFKAVDNVGNESIMPHIITNIDDVPPVITITADTVTIKENVTFTVNAKDADTNITKLEYRINGGEWQALDITQGQKSVDVTLTATDNHTTYEFRAYDQALNESKHQSVTFNNIYTGTEDPFDIIGIKHISPDLPVEAETVIIIEGSVMNVEEGASVDAGTLMLNGKDAIVNNGSVTADTLSVVGQDNRISGNIVEVDNITLAEGAELGVDKDQYDNFMNNSEFTTANGKLIVSGSIGNALRTSNIDTLMNKGNIANVEFKQDLIDINKLNVKSTKTATISFGDAYGTTNSDTIRFYKDTNVVFGTAGRDINLEEGSNTIQIDKNAKTTIKSNLTNVSTVKSASGSTVETADITFQSGRSATLKAEGTSFTAGNINGATDKATSITTATETTFKAGAFKFGEKNDKISIGKNGSFTAAGIDFGAGSDTLNLGKSSELKADDIIGAETISFEAYSNAQVGNIDGTKKITVSSGSSKSGGATLKAGNLFGIAGSTNSYSFGNYNTAELGNIVTQEKNDTVKIGSDSKFSAASIDLGEGKDTLSIGARSDAKIAGNVAGVYKLTLSNGSYDKKSGVTSWTKLTAADVAGTANSDTFSFGNYSDVNLKRIDFAAGNDTLKIGDYAKANIAGDIDFADGKNTIQVGKYSEVVLKTFDASAVTKLTIGKESNAYLSSELFNAVTKVDKTASVYDIGSFDVAKSFTSIADETSDNQFADARTLETADYDGWLCGENNLDLTDFFNRGSAVSVTRIPTNAVEETDLVFAQYDADGQQIGSSVAFYDMINFAANAVAFSITLANEEEKASNYRIQLA